MRTFLTYFRLLKYIMKSEIDLDIFYEFIIFQSLKTNKQKKDSSLRNESSLNLDDRSIILDFLKICLKD